MDVLRIGHSPDPDDAFMFYAFATGVVTVAGYEVQQVLKDIESLNQLAMQGDIEVTAISAGAYPRLAHQYRIMACGASVGAQLRTDAVVQVNQRSHRLGRQEDRHTG